MRIALTGNPNSGKTTMYNALTGRNEKVDNWAGVTVERKEHPIKKQYAGGEELIAVDLPGAYSMSPFTSEESITSSYVRSERPDAIINIVDATNLSRSLFFTTQLLELGIPVVVALNKSDLNEKAGTVINTALLAEKLGCPVVGTVSTDGGGLEQVIAATLALRGNGQKAPYTQGEINLTDKRAVEEADRRRFAFVDHLVRQVETRRTLTREKGKGDAIDAVLLVPVVGVLSWQLAAAAVTGFIAKENVVGTLAVCFVGLENLTDTDELALLEGAGAQAAGILAITKVAALAYMMFNLYTPPCFAAIGAMSAEIKSKKWLFAGIGLQLGIGYTIGFGVYQIGTLVTTGAFGAGFLPGLVAVSAFLALLVWLCLRAGRNITRDYALGGVKA